MGRGTDVAPWHPPHVLALCLCVPAPRAGAAPPKMVRRRLLTVYSTAD